MATVLIGEHVPDIRLAMTIVFRRRGHEVLSVGDGSGVIDAALRFLPNVILLNLPDDDAVTVCRQLRRQPDTARIGIIIMSADLHPDQTDADAAGADDYVTKPFDNDDLVARAEALLPPAHRGSPVRPPAARSPELRLGTEPRPLVRPLY